MCATFKKAGLLLLLPILATGCRTPSGSPVDKKIPPFGTPGTLVTVAGTGKPAAFRPGLTGTQTHLNAPMGIAIDRSGNLLFTDGQQVIRRDAMGRLFRLAGTGVAGFSGDGGPATRARLRFPVHLAVDAAGRVYVTDRNNQCIRRIDPNGTIATVAGIPSSQPKGGFSGDGGPAVHARFYSPGGIALDRRGDLFIADTMNQRIRKVGPDGIISTVAGSGFHDRLDRGGFSGDGGPALRARLNRPDGIAVDVAGNLYIADADNQRVRRVDRSGRIVTVAGTGQAGYSGDGGPADRARLYTPYDVALDRNGDLFIVEMYNHSVREVRPDGRIATVAGKVDPGETKCCVDSYDTPEGSPATETELYYPFGLAIDPEGDLFLTDTKNHRVREVFKVAAPGLLAGGPFPPNSKIPGA